MFGEGSDVQNQYDLKLNQLALKKSKDVTITETKKKLFDFLNAEEIEEKVVTEYEVDKINEDVLVSNVTKEDWALECDRVSNQLLMPIQKTDDALDDFYDRRQQVLGHLNTISEFTQGNTPILLDTLIESTKKDLKRIKKKEQKLNT